MVLSASSPSSLATTGSSYTYVKKQAFCAVLGVALMLIISKIDYRKYQRFYKIAYVVSLFILLLVLVPGLRKRGKRCKTLDKKCSNSFIISTIRNYKNRNNSILRIISNQTQRWAKRFMEGIYKTNSIFRITNCWRFIRRTITS